MVRNRLSGIGAMGLTHVSKKQSQVVIDFGGRSDGRARVSSTRALFNGNGRRKALDVVHVGLLHLIQKLPRIRRQGFDIFATALRKDRVKCQGGLPRAAQTGKDHQLISRNFEGDILEVVLSRPSNAYPILPHEFDFFCCLIGVNEPIRARTVICNVPYLGRVARLGPCRNGEIRPTRWVAALHITQSGGKLRLGINFQTQAAEAHLHRPT